MLDFTIREAVPEDAESFLEHRRRIVNEPNSMIVTSAQDRPRTVEEQRKLITDYLEADNALMLVVETEGEIIGEISVRGGQRAANRHVVGLGIDVRKEWRDQGLGTALMRRAMEWARATGIVRRIELEVFVHNTRALHVYEKLGFKVEGRKEQAYYRDGQYIDAFMMALLLNPGGDRSTEQR